MDEGAGKDIAGRGQEKTNGDAGDNNNCSFISKALVGGSWTMHDQRLFKMSPLELLFATSGDCF